MNSCTGGGACAPLKYSLHISFSPAIASSNPEAFSDLIRKANQPDGVKWKGKLKTVSLWFSKLDRQFFFLIIDILCLYGRYCLPRLY
jgi:hypothetical protein